MIRFIDLRYQGTQNRFAFWDTVIDSFLSFDGEMAWTTLDEFIEASYTSKELSARCAALCPPWTQLEANEEELDFRVTNEMSTICPDCGHHVNAHDEYGTCDICQDELDDMPGGAQGAHLESCPSLERMISW